MFLVLMSVFSFLFASQPAYRLNLIIGLFLYDFFGESTKAGLASLHSKGYLLAKAKFPTAAVVISSIANAVLTLSVFVIVMVIWATVAAGAVPARALMMFIVYLLLYIAIVIGFSLATSVLYLRFRDLNQVWDVAIQAGFFLAPIVYPLNIIPEKFHYYLYFWPPTAIIQFSRMVLVQGTAPTVKAHTFLFFEAAVVLLTGTAIFRKYARRAAEYL
jgi:lipopolysaccharide transport system permease protein